MLSLQDMVAYDIGKNICINFKHTHLLLESINLYNLQMNLGKNRSYLLIRDEKNALSNHLIIH